MISLALGKKLPVTEDPLTAAFADLLRYEPGPELLKAVLAKAQPLVKGAALPLDFDSYSVKVWPVLEGREPDLRLELARNGRQVARLIIEAKLGAGKSGTGEIDSVTRSGDQLGYYLKHETERPPVTRVSLLYLTQHGSIPTGDLNDSAGELGKRGGEHLVGELFWLSWREVHEVLDAVSATSQVVRDMVQLLHMVQMFRFRAFRTSAALGGLGTPSFFAGKKRERRYFGSSGPPPSLGPMGWQYVRRTVRRSYGWPGSPTGLSGASFYGSAHER